MGWDESLPLDAQALRTLSSVIRNNWDAIEQADEVSGDKLLYYSSQFGNRSTIASNADPITSATTHFVYSKNDGGGTQELYTEDAAGNVIQMTNDGALGGPNVPMQVEDGWSFTGSNLVWAYGRVPAGGGAITGGQGLGNATVKTIAGQAGAYEIALTRTPANANYMVWGVPITNSGLFNGRVIEYVDTSATTSVFGVRMKRCNDGNTITTEPFFIAVIGGF